MAGGPSVGYYACVANGATSPRAALFLSLSMTMLGLVGMFGGYGALGAEPVGLDDPSLSPEVIAAREEVAVAAARTSIPRGLGIANMLASSTLLIAGTLISLRRQSALWWTNQALLINVVYTVADGIGNVVLSRRVRPELEELTRLAIREGEPLDPAQADMFMSMMPWVLDGLIVVRCLLVLGVYGIMVRYARRDDVATYVRRS